MSSDPFDHQDFGAAGGRMSCDPFDQHGFGARVEWGPYGLRRLARACDVVVIIDVLSFTTALAGERWHGNTGPIRPAMEDLLGAGALLSALAPSTPSPEARAAMAAFADAAPHLGRRLEECASGRELIDGGFTDDVRLAAELNVSPVAPRLEGDSFVDAS
jgi:hypothetical protein